MTVPPMPSTPPSSPSTSPSASALQTAEDDSFLLPQPFFPELTIISWQARIFLFTAVITAFVAGYWGSTVTNITWKAPVAALIAMFIAGKLMHVGLQIISDGIMKTKPATVDEPQEQA